MTAPYQRSGESDEAYYKRLAAIADRRLERLETNVYKGDLFNALTVNSAYHNAVEDIQAFTGDESAMRFRRALVKNADGSLNKKNLHMRLNAVKRFIESPSSTVTGHKKVIKTRTNSLNKNMGTKFTPQQAESIFTNSRWKDMSNKYGSKTVLKAIGEINKMPNKEDLEKLADKDIYVSDDDVINEVSKELIKEGFTLDKLL